MLAECKLSVKMKRHSAKRLSVTRIHCAHRTLVDMSI